jgi:hypothetical protein
MQQQPHEDEECQLFALLQLRGRTDLLLARAIHISNQFTSSLHLVRNTYLFKNLYEAEISWKRPSNSFFLASPAGMRSGCQRKAISRKPFFSGASRRLSMPAGSSRHFRCGTSMSGMSGLGGTVLPGGTVLDDDDDDEEEEEEEEDAEEALALLSALAFFRAAACSSNFNAFRFTLPRFFNLPPRNICPSAKAAMQPAPTASMVTLSESFFFLIFSAAACSAAAVVVGLEALIMMRRRDWPCLCYRD